MASPAGRWAIPARRSRSASRRRTWASSRRNRRSRQLASRPYCRTITRMADQKLVGVDYTTPDLVAKVTGRAKYAEDYRADGMLFTKLLLSPMPHARVRRIDTRAALATAGVKAIITADDLPDLRGAERALTNEPL